MALTLMDFPDLVAIEMTAPVFFNDKAWLADVNGLALFTDWGELKEVALWGNDDQGRDVFEVLPARSDNPMHQALRPYLWAEASGSYTRKKFLESSERPLRKRQPSLQQEYGTYGRTP